MEREVKFVKNRERRCVLFTGSQEWMFRLVNGLKTDSKEVEGGRCMRGGDGKLCFSEKDRGIVWKDSMERIMNEKNDWDHNVEGDAL